MSETSSTDPKMKNKKADTMPIEPNYQPINWKRVFFTPKYIPVWIIMILIGVLTAVITLKHDQVVDALRPFAEKVRNIPAGWLIFVAVLFVISFPPLFGHELVALLAGVVYGLWIGFAVVAAGTFIGESECIPLLYMNLYSCPRRGRFIDSTLTRTHSRDMVRLQEGLPAQSTEDGDDKPYLRLDGQVMP
jgi:hypothetical protein